MNPRRISPAEREVLAQALSVCATERATPAHTKAVDTLQVASTCECGCDTVSFCGSEAVPVPMILADGLGETASGHSVGLIVFGTEDLITCLEVYNFDDVPAKLPTVSSIRGFGQEAGLPSNTSLERSRDG
jgi:hypothetical protein